MSKVHIEPMCYYGFPIEPMCFKMDAIIAANAPYKIKKQTGYDLLYYLSLLFVFIICLYYLSLFDSLSRPDNLKFNLSIEPFRTQLVFLYVRILLCKNQ